MYSGLAIAKLTPLFAGQIFGLGLLLACIANPIKVLAFLDLIGSCAQSLALVMGGTTAVALSL